MAAFRGLNVMNVDSKGRVACPARYKQQGLFAHESCFVVTIDPEDPCLLLYPLAQWEVIEASIESLPSFHPTTRRVKRLLIGHATEVFCDKQSRVLIPAALREYAAIDKTLMFVGQGKKVELWSEAVWHKHRQAWLETDDQELPDALSEVVL